MRTARLYVKLQLTARLYGQDKIITKSWRNWT